MTMTRPCRRITLHLSQIFFTDGWTVVTKDGSRAAHFEHTVAITPEGPWVLTAEDGGVAGLAPFGVTPRT